MSEYLGFKPDGSTTGIRTNGAPESCRVLGGCVHSKDGDEWFIWSNISDVKDGPGWCSIPFEEVPAHIKTIFLLIT